MHLFTGARGSSVVDDGGSSGERARSIVNDPTKAMIYANSFKKGTAWTFS